MADDNTKLSENQEITVELSNVRRLLNDARSFMEEHGYFYDGDFPETNGAEVIKFDGEDGRTDKRCWLKCHYLEKENGLPGLRVTFNKHDGTSGPNITKVFFLGHTWLKYRNSYKNKTERELGKYRRKAREKAKKEQAFADELADKSRDRFYRLSKEPPQNAVTYFSKKGMKNPYDIHSIRWECVLDFSEKIPQEKWVAIVALRNAKGEIRAIQELWPEKRVFRKGQAPRNKNYVGKTGGNFFCYGSLKNEEEILVCEGVATAITVFQITGKTAVAAMDAGNLDKVLGGLLFRFRNLKPTICADNDHHQLDNPAVKKNPGLEAARNAAIKYKCKLAVPNFSDEQLFDNDGKARTDFDDMRQLGLDEEIRKIIETATVPIEVPNESSNKCGERPKWLDDLNKNHAVVHHNSTYILTEKYEPTINRQTFSLESVSSFHTWYKPEKDAKGEQVSKHWLAHPNRRQYSGGIVFDPREKGHFKNYYNLFQGFDVEAKEGESNLFWQLVFEGLSAGNAEISTYIRKWLAHMIQKPWELPEVAIALRGMQGTGKGTFMKYVSKLVRRYYHELSQMGQVVGRFNSHLKDALLIYANEAVWGGNKSEVGALKAMITDEMQAIEQKGIDIILVKNCKRFVFSSNEDWIVPMDIDDRRFLVSDVNPKFKENEDFFGMLRNQMENGGVAALMWDLQNEDISNWHPRRKPRCIDGFDLKLKSMKSPHKWLFECLSKERMMIQIEDGDPTIEGGIVRWDEEEEGEVRKDRLYQDYKYFCENAKLKIEDERVFWKKIKEVFGKLDESRRNVNGIRFYTIALPNLKKAREAFAQFAKEDFDDLWDG